MHVPNCHQATSEDDRAAIIRAHPPATVVLHDGSSRRGKASTGGTGVRGLEA